ncbi:PAS domain-containing protein [Jannaschia sp. LMIT008]|uniref:PAS domain-containing protein n=1 Tax=Jannaschia maritima TaxID=3032585 RepID=UPI00281194EB|nr:PAS domain-containing protein [Jannaschia sp. LMIT008]
MSEEDANAIFRSADIAMVLTNPNLDDNPIVYVNRAFETLTGYTAEMALGRNCRFLQTDQTSPEEVAELHEAIEKREHTAVVLLNERANGETFLNALIVSPIFDEQTGQANYFVGLQSEIPRDARDEKLKSFENLVSEIQHRVKNHLTMILGLIRLKARQSDDGQTFDDLSRRIEGLQLLYEEMTAARANTNEDRVQLGSYLGRVASAIAHLDGRSGVRMNIQVEAVLAETDIAVRIGLIVSEILTNAMQHAFKDQPTGLVDLRVTRTDDQGIRVVVTDDGVGLPDDVDWPGDDGLGGRIVEGLCKGLNATLHVSRGAVGTVIVLDVPSVL